MGSEPKEEKNHLNLNEEIRGVKIRILLGNISDIISYTDFILEDNIIWRGRSGRI